MSRRPIPISEIRGRMETLPLDIRNIIEPISIYEYNILNPVVESIADKISSSIFLPKFVNYDAIYNHIYEILKTYGGYSLSSLLEKFGRDYGKRGQTEKIPYRQFIEYIDIYIISNIVHSFFNYTFYKRAGVKTDYFNDLIIFVRSKIIDYIIQLFMVAGYFVNGAKLVELVDIFNRE